MSKILSTRHRWCLSQVYKNLDVDETEAERSFGQDDNFEVLDSFLKAGGPSRIFAYYQQRSKKLETGEWELVDGPKELFLTAGDGEGLKGSCVYFVRKRVGEALDLAAGDDGAIVAGTLSGSPLTDLSAILGQVYLPFMQTREKWGSAPEDETKEFVSEFANFTGDIGEARKSLVGGIEMRKPDKKFDLESRTIKRDGTF